MRKIKILLWMVICCLLISNVAMVHAEESSAFTSEESYLTRSLLDLYKCNVLQFEEGSGKVTFVEKSDGILVEGSTSAVTSGKFKINKTFNFDGNRVGRLSLDALAGKGEDLTVRFYLDNNNESFASITVPQQGREGLWTRDIAIQTDVLGKNITGEHTVSFSVEAAEGTEKAAILLRSIEFVENSIPTVYMNLDESLGTVSEMNNSATKVDECYGSMQIEIPAGYTYEYGENAGKTTTEDLTTDYELSYLRGRGNSTWQSDKKPYKIKLQKGASLVGMAKNKHWALIANRYDSSKLRNKMTYWIGDQVNLEYSPDLVPVDVVMNGIYFGSYYLSETIRADESRLDIDSLDDSSKQSITDPSEITGGYLLNFHAWGDSDTAKYFTTSRGLELTYTSPSYEDYENESQMNYLKEYCQKVEDALYGDNFKDANGVSYTEYMDLDSAVDFYLLQEIACNGDSYETGSTYLYKKKDGKLYWGPIWDFDAVAYNCTFGMDDAAGLEIIAKLESSKIYWIERLVQDPVFKKRLAERWPIFKEKFEEYCKDGGVMDQYYDKYLKVSLRYDEEKWGLIYINAESAESAQEKCVSCEHEKERLKKWTLDRINWIDSHVIDRYRADNYKITFMADGKAVSVVDAYSGYAIESMPVAPAKSGYLFEAWMICDSNGKDTGSYADESTVFTADTTLRAVYVSAKNLVAPTSLYLSNTVINCNYSDSTSSSAKIVLYSSVYPQGAYGTIKYVSTDTQVVKVDQNGVLSLEGEGDATIVVSCGSLKKSCKVHVSADDAVGDEPILSPTKTSMKVGQQKQITMKFSESYPMYFAYDWSSTNKSVATVDQCGVITAKKAGTATIVLSNSSGSTICTCQVTVTKAFKSSIKKGYTYTYKGLKYKVTSKAAKGGNVTVLGPTGKKIRSVNIRSTLTIKGETFKVTGISYKAFYNCKKLRKVYLGKNLKSIGRKAFTGINKHARFRVPASKKKAYKKLLTSSRGFKKKTMKIYQ